MDCNILGSILGSPDFGKLPYITTGPEGPFSGVANSRLVHDRTGLLLRFCYRVHVEVSGFGCTVLLKAS